ncbi:MAG: site-specific DNA-methyltransferase, partial [Armatimonadetes bacterium]|nr:site-specific DNA-methyltransferase [Armatimonadota bacterium]
ELIWEGKYDASGRKTAPVRIALPFQTIETVNESAQQRQRTLDLFSSGKPTEWRNRLIWGDKKYVLPSLLPEFAGQVNLIYIDPPFDTGADFSFTTTIPDTDESFTKEPSVLEQKAYRDTWGRGLDSYLQWLYETVAMLHELLADEGVLLVHLNSLMAPCGRLIVDEVCGGGSNYRNAMVVSRGTKNLQGQFESLQSLSCGYDVVLLYSASPSRRFRKLEIDLPTRREGTWNNHWRGTDRPTMRYPLLGVPAPTSGQWRWSRERTERAVANYATHEAEAPHTSIDEYYLRHLEQTGQALDFVRLSSTGKPEHYVPPADTRLASDVLTGVHTVGKLTGYPTEKHEDLLETFIAWLSNEGDLVLDCFCGSGTTAAVAEKLGRRWIACDLGRFAIHVTRKRLLGIENVRPFVVQNLGKYERQAWQAAEFEHPEDGQAREAAYRRFILDLYHAEPVTGHTWLHGVKASRMVHVATVDAPVTVADVRGIVSEVWKAAGAVGASAAVDVLGWEFAFELNEIAKQMAAEAKVDATFRRIPREVLEKKAVEQGDIRFFELAALSVNVKQTKRNVSLELTDFVIPPDDVPEDVRRSVTHWEQWIDYWAVDWDFRGDTFHNQWQSYRTRKDPSLQKKIVHTYEEPGEYTILVKVIDILGNDTTKSVTVKVT